MKSNINPNLTDEQKEVLFKKSTERPFSGKLLNNKDDGVYTCANCGQEIFKSETKFDSGSGWPSFYDVIEQGKVKLIEDKSHEMIRTEVVCANCGGHLGHLFEDGPDPTGQRYCVNSLSLQFKPEQNEVYN